MEDMEYFVGVILIASLAFCVFYAVFDFMMDWATCRVMLKYLKVGDAYALSMTDLADGSVFVYRVTVVAVDKEKKELSYEDEDGYKSTCSLSDFFCYYHYERV